jgi:hypothetical protein
LTSFLGISENFVAMAAVRKVVSTAISWENHEKASLLSLPKLLEKFSESSQDQSCEITTGIRGEEEAF